MHAMTLAQMARGLAAGEFSSEELVRHLLVRIGELDG
jgi:Asp-tRNA(Asn)/Glu-tRNA(Gln) amidotransferase A subunit family amidase